MRAYLAPESAVSAWLHGLATRYALYFPQRVGAANWDFLRVTSTSEFQFHSYRPTVVPPTRHLVPDNEVLFEFHREPDGAIALERFADRTERILAGVRPCDLRAIAQMDAVHADPPPDPNYLERRRATRIVALNCLHPCDEHAFCAATGSLYHTEGADLFLTPCGEELLIEALTPAGEALVADAGFEPCPDAQRLRDQEEATRPEPFGRQLTAAAAEMPAILRAAYASPVWAAYAERCFSCGTCNLVCPTCYCFEVCDELGLDGASGCRTRTWDSCMIPDFAVVASGHNFRPTCADRQRHRIKRKFEYLPDRFGLGSFCVGCGRCGRQCTTGIDIFDMVNDIAAAARSGP